MSTTYAPLRKGTVLIPSGPVEHLHFICCDPVHHSATGKDSVLMVNISSITPHLEHDMTCVLNPGDHPFIKHPSFVYYRKASIYGAQGISRNVAEGNFSTHIPCDEAVFRQILIGFEVSDEVSYKILRFYENHCR